MAERRFLVEGPQAVRAALARGAVGELFSTGAHPDLEQAAERGGTPVTRVTEAVLAAMAETVTPQGVLGVAPLVDVGLADLPASPRLVVVLVAVSDPGNAGTILRTADAAGADAVVFTAGSADPHAGKCVRASAGSLWHLPVVTGPSTEQALAALRERNLQLLATTGAGEDDLADLDDALRAPTAWLFGTEAHGLGAEVLAAADRRVRIPLYGGAESLNVAAAAAICLYATARAHRAT